MKNLKTFLESLLAGQANAEANADNFIKDFGPDSFSAKYEVREAVRGTYTYPPTYIDHVSNFNRTFDWKKIKDHLKQYRVTEPVYFTKDSRNINPTCVDRLNLLIAYISSIQVDGLDGLVDGTGFNEPNQKLHKALKDAINAVSTGRELEVNPTIFKNGEEIDIAPYIEHVKPNRKNTCKIRFYKK
jgi:hypothetical protein